MSRRGFVPLVVTLAIVFRLGLIVYGTYQDAHSPLKYTDVDYRVFSDAARFVLHPTAPEQYAKGPLAQWLNLGLGDPYQRATYRYTPLLALLLVPNELLHPAWGKLLFSLGDIFIGLLLFSLATASAPSKNTRFGAPTLVTVLWLLNPMPANISTRGSAESILGLLVISTLALCMKRRYDAAAIMLGLAVHFKIYPFIYGISILASMPTTPLKGLSAIEWARRHITLQRLRFVTISLATFAGLNLVMYLLWGHPFLEHTYLYHIARRDHRHNFAPHFYGIYLTYSSASSSLSLVTRVLRSPLASFIPQMILSLGPGLMVRREDDLPFVWFVQTCLFVTFNKVCTSQYFMWYLWFLPLILPQLSLSLRKGVVLISTWVGAQALWLSFAYRLEFLGEATFLPLWGASLIMLGANSFVIGQLVDAYR